MTETAVTKFDMYTMSIRQPGVTITLGLKGQRSSEDRKAVANARARWMRCMNTMNDAHNCVLQETQLMLTNRVTRLEVSQGHQT